MAPYLIGGGGTSTPAAIDEKEGNPPEGGPVMPVPTPDPDPGPVPGPPPAVRGVMGVGGPYDEFEVLVGATLDARATAKASGGTC